MALVDARTVDSEHDTIPADVVFPTWVTENMQVKYSDQYRWYYLSDQMPDEALIFKSADSDGSSACGQCLYVSDYVTNLQQRARMLDSITSADERRTYLEKASTVEHLCFMLTSMSFLRRLEHYLKAFMVTWGEASAYLILLTSR